MLVFPVSAQSSQRNPFEDEEWPTVLRGSCVEQTRDLFVLELRHDLALLPKSANELIRVEAAFDNFNCNLAHELIIVADSQVDCSHTSTAENGDNAIVSQALGQITILVAAKVAGSGRSLSGRVSAVIAVFRLNPTRPTRAKFTGGSIPRCRTSGPQVQP
jgi:hypothetical protein